MKTVEVLEQIRHQAESNLRDCENHNECPPEVANDVRKEVAALTEAIAALKGKSDAEAVLKVAERHGWPINPPAPWLGVGYNEWQVQHVSAPTLSELAAKLEKIK